MSSYVLLSSRSSALMARLQPSWIRYLACQDLEQRPHTFIYGSHCTSLCLISQSRSQPMQQSSSIRRAQHGPMEHHPPPSLLVEFLNMNLLDHNSGLSLPCPPAATPCWVHVESFTRCLTTGGGKAAPQTPFLMRREPGLPGFCDVAP